LDRSHRWHPDRHRRRRVPKRWQPRVVAVQADGFLHTIRDGGTYRCLTAAGAPVVSEGAFQLAKLPVSSEPGLTPEDRSDPCEGFARPGSWARKETIT